MTARVRLQEPTFPRPKRSRKLEAAIEDAVRLADDMPPTGMSPIELAVLLNKKGHSLGMAQWAVYDLAEMGGLQVDQKYDSPGAAVANMAGDMLTQMGFGPVKQCAWNEARVLPTAGLGRKTSPDVPDSPDSPARLPNASQSAAGDEGAANPAQEAPDAGRALDVSKYSNALDGLRQSLIGFVEERETSCGSSDSIDWDEVEAGGMVHSAIEEVQACFSDGKLPLGLPHVAWLRLQDACQRQDTAAAEENVVGLLGWIDEHLKRLATNQSGEQYPPKKRRNSKYLRVHEMLDKEDVPDQHQRADLVKRYNERWANKSDPKAPEGKWPKITVADLGEIIRNRDKRRKA